MHKPMLIEHILQIKALPQMATRYDVETAVVRRRCIEVDIDEERGA